MIADHLIHFRIAEKFDKYFYTGGRTNISPKIQCLEAIADLDLSNL
jgi:hypothetical protein